MVINNALWIAGCAAGVVQGDSVPFIRRGLPVEVWITARNKFFVFNCADKIAAVKTIINADHKGFGFAKVSTSGTIATQWQKVVSALGENTIPAANATGHAA